MRISVENIEEAEMWAFVELLWQRFHRAKSIGFDVTDLTTGQVTHLKGDKMAYLLPDDKKVTLSIQPVDAKGNPAKIDGVPAWASSDPGLLEVTPAADGLSAVAVPVGGLGVAQVNVSADADLGEGVKPISGILDIEIQAGEAVALTISAGAPEAV